MKYLLSCRESWPITSVALMVPRLLIAAVGLSLVANSAFAVLLVTSRGGDEVRAFNEVTGADLGIFASLTAPDGIEIGPDGNVYVTEQATPDHRILRFDAQTGALLPGTGVGNLAWPEDPGFGSDGNLYVPSFQNQQITRFSGATLANLGVFSNLDFPRNADLEFGPDGHIYITTYAPENSVGRIHGTTGNYLGAFTTGGSLSAPDGLTFGPDGDLYVSNRGNNRVDRFNGTTGVFLSTFANVTNPHGLEFGPDGNLYVIAGAEVVRLDGTTGALLGSFGDTLLSDPQNLAFVPEPPTLVLAVLSLLGFLAWGWRRRR